MIDAGKEPTIPEELDIIGVRERLNTRPKPIMIEIMEISDDNIVLENGDDASLLLREMREVFPKLPVSEQFEKLQFCNFRLLRPVVSSSLRFYEVEHRGTLLDQDFEYFLTRIR